MRRRGFAYPRLVRFHPLLPSWLVLLALAGIQLRHVQGTLPYPQHPDERVLMLGAARILDSSNWNPRVYAYPSLPIYLNTAALSLGLIAASGKGPAAVLVKDIGRLEAPYYGQPHVVAVARELWALMSVGIALGMVLVAFRMAGALVAFVTALLWGFSGLLGLGASYVNSDIPMTMFASLCLAQLQFGAGSASRWQRVWAPALLCGAAIACKYTGFVLLLPCLLSIWLHRERDHGLDSLVLVFGTLLTFLVLCPYFLLDLHNFLDGIAFENFHYRVRGHAGFDVQPGWRQLRAHFLDVVDDYGWTLTALAGIGLGSCLWLPARRVALLLAMPIATLVFLAGYKVHFVRNGAPLLMILPLLAALGGVAIARVLRDRLRRFAPLASGQRAEYVCVVLLVALAVSTLPLPDALQTLASPDDSRNALGRWAQAKSPNLLRLHVPTVLPISPTSLPAYLQVLPIDLSDAQATVAALEPGTYLLLPEWSPRHGWRGKRVALLAPGLAVIPPHEVIARFGSVPVVPSLGNELCKDPAFAIVRIKPAPL